MTRNWAGTKVLIVGAARQGLALARFLAARGAQVTLNDQHSPAQMQEAIDSLATASPDALPVEWALGGHPLELLDRADLVCISGGVPLTLPIIVETMRRGLPLTNDSQIFMEACPAPVIGITGSAGKTTTTTLVGRMAEDFARLTRRSSGNRKAWIGGNIGLPLVEYVDAIRPDDLVIVEFSSFQLEQMTVSPHIGAVLNITPNHLDRHGTLEAYAAAKARILEFQGAEDVAVLNREDPGSWALVEKVRGRLVTFGVEKPENGASGAYLRGETLVFTDGMGEIDLLPRELIRLRGEHNLRNVLAACAIACAAGFPVESIQAGVRDFTGVAHRLELVREWKGAEWYNCSISTAPERTMADIDVFDEPLVLLLGGRDKNLPWEKLAELVHRRVDHVIVFGEAAEKILKAIGPINLGGEVQTGDRLQTIHRAAGLQAAMQTAAEIVQPGDVVLLSPGGTSFDEFKDFEERGERFREWVKALL
jgi:UDP-N-acetylmuramoylalanine--D-glutamate ligase